MICTYVAATVPMEREGQVNELLEAAKSIGADPSKEEKEAAKQPVNDPPVGSFENFMSTFGNPGRWAGR